MLIFYQELGRILPATYDVNRYFCLIYDGGNLISDFKSLCVIIGSLLIIYLWREQSLKCRK